MTSPPTPSHYPLPTDMNPPCPSSPFPSQGYPPTNRLGNLSLPLVVPLLIGWFGLLVFLLIRIIPLFWNFTIDDAFITFSYTRNLVLGKGLVFTEGERAEATSSLLWALLLVPFEAWLKDGAVIGSKILGGIGMATAIGIGALLVREDRRAVRVPRSSVSREAWVARLFFATLCVLSAPFVQWSFYGMEHGGVASLLMISLLLFRREIRSGSGWFSAIPVFLLETIRPEGFMAMAVFGVFRTLLAFKRTGSWKCWKDELWLNWVGAVMVLFFGYELFGFLHFGHLFPNTVSAKAGTLSWEIVHEGIYYFSTTAGRMYLGMSGILGLWMGCRLLGAAAWKNRQSLSHSMILDLLIYALVLTQIVFIVLVGGDWMINFRFLSHIAPLIALLWVRMTFPGGIDDVDRTDCHPFDAVDEGSKRWNAVRFPGGLVSHPGFQVVFLLVYLVYQIQAGITGHAWAERLEAAEERVLKGTALLLESWRKSSEDMVACSDVGRMGYYYRGRVYDWWGLATEEVARSGQARGRIDPRTVLRHKPRFIVLYSNERRLGPDTMQRDMARHSRAFFRDPEFQAEYVAVAPFFFWEDRWHIVFERVVSTEVSG